MDFAFGIVFYPADNGLFIYKLSELTHNNNDKKGDKITTGSEIKKEFVVQDYDNTGAEVERKQWFVAWPHRFHSNL